MVYESDFYTTRRPYTTYRPSTYSVTPLHIRFAPALPRVHTVTTYYPYGTSRLVGAPRTRIMTSPTPPHHVITVRVRPSVVLRELDRIASRRRAELSYSPTEDFLRSESSKAWEDETRRIRADTNSLMQQIRSAVPRASSVVPYSTYLAYEPLPIRLSSEDYLARLLQPIRSVSSDIRNLSWYAEPAKRFTGKGHLACIRYSGNKGFPNRRSLYSDLSVKDDVTLLSFYAKNRLAAAGLSLDSVTVKLLPYRASRKFGKPAVMEDPALELKAAKAERLERFNREEASGAAAGGDADALADRKKKRQEEAQLSEERALAEEQARRKEAAKRDEEARSAELARQELLAAQAAAERQAEIDRKAELARQAEEEAEAQRQAEEEVRLAEKAKAARLAQEAKLAEEARLAEEAKLAEEARRAEEDRLAAEAEELRQTEMARLAELEQQAQEEKEAELARQAAELAEIARQESELAAAARQEAELAELARQEAELAELERQEAELAELERQEAELKAQEAEAEIEADPALAADSTEADEENSPVVEEPESQTQDVEAEPAAESEDEQAEPDLTDEE